MNKNIRMTSLEHVQDGDRVYLNDNNQYGDVERKGFLGLKKSVILSCDDGTRKAYCGQPAVQNVINKGTGENGIGETVSLPTDVKEVGPSILSGLGIAAEDQVAFFQKFMVLDPAVRQEKIQYWVDNNSDAGKIATFYSELLTLLESDDLYVQTQAAGLLRHLDEETKQHMSTALFSTTTSAERRDLILQFTQAKVSRSKTQEFLQAMYKRFMNDSVYLKMEFKKAIAKLHIFDPQASQMIDSFITDTPESTISDIVRDWRDKKLYKSEVGPTYAHRYIKAYE